MVGYDADGGSGKPGYKSLISPVRSDLKEKNFAPDPSSQESECGFLQL